MSALTVLDLEGEATLKKACDTIRESLIKVGVVSTQESFTTLTHSSGLTLTKENDSYVLTRNEQTATIPVKDLQVYYYADFSRIRTKFWIQKVVFENVNVEEHFSSLLLSLYSYIVRIPSDPTYPTKLCLRNLRKTAATGGELVGEILSTNTNEELIQTLIRWRKAWFDGYHPEVIVSRTVFIAPAVAVDTVNAFNQFLGAALYTSDHPKAPITWCSDVLGLTGMSNLLARVTDEITRLVFLTGYVEPAPPPWLQRELQASALRRGPSNITNVGLLGYLRSCFNHGIHFNMDRITPSRAWGFMRGMTSAVGAVAMSLSGYSSWLVSGAILNAYWQLALFSGSRPEADRSQLGQELFSATKRRKETLDRYESQDDPMFTYHPHPTYGRIHNVLDYLMDLAYYKTRVDVLELNETALANDTVDVGVVTVPAGTGPRFKNVTSEMGHLFMYSTLKTLHLGGQGMLYDVLGLLEELKKKGCVLERLIMDVEMFGVNETRAAVRMDSITHRMLQWHYVPLFQSLQLVGSFNYSKSWNFMELIRALQEEAKSLTLEGKFTRLQLTTMLQSIEPAVRFHSLDVTCADHTEKDPPGTLLHIGIPAATKFLRLMGWFPYLGATQGAFYRQTLETAHEHTPGFTFEMPVETE
jgi:hypothetical protein